MVLRRWRVEQDNLVLSTELIMEIGYLKEFLNVLSVRAKSERNVGLTLKISALVTR